MQKEKLYTKSGWIDADLLIDAPEPFVVALGGRGIGKTYSVLLQLYRRNIPFIYMRRTQTQIDAVAVPQLNPYNQISIDIGEPIISGKISKHAAGFYHAVVNNKGVLVPDGEPFAIGIALSTFAAIRGLSAERFDVVLFDEIIPERHEKPIKEEGTAFANVLESLNRNRELQGRPPLKVIMLSNSNTLNSKILESIGCIKPLDEMQRRGAWYRSIDGLIAIFRYIDSPISNRKQAGALYRVIKNNDFVEMSLNNGFAAADYENVCNKPLSEFNTICSYGNCTVMKHKSRKEYYVVDGIKSDNHYDRLPLSKKAFQRKYYYLYGAMLDKRVFYQNAEVKIEFEESFK